VARGLRLSARAWTALTALKVVALVAVAFAAHGARAAPQVAVHPSLAWPGFSAVLVAAFCYQGFEVTALVAGQGRASRPIVAAFLTAALFYAFVVLGGASVASHAGAARAMAVSSLGIAFAMVAMTPRYLTAMVASVGERHALAITVVVVGALVLVGPRAELFTVATLAVVAQYAASALALLRVGAGGGDRLVALGTLGTSAVLAFGASLREGVVFVAVLVAGAVLSRTVTGKSPTRHAP
jgi:hypothetical protein